MTGAELKASILQAAVQGRLVPQDAGDEPASVLLRSIREERLRLALQKKVKIPRGGDSVIERYPDGTVWERRGKGPAVEITDEVLFDIPDGWEWARLESIIDDTRAGKSPKCVNRPASDGEWGVLKTTAIQIGKYHADENKVLPRTFRIDQSWVPVAGDVLITRAGPKGRTGVSCLVDKSENVILSDKTVAFRLLGGSYGQYVVTCINSPCVRQEIEAIMTGMSASQVNISQASLKTLLIPVPPLAEQERIVAKLDEVMPLVERYDRLDRERTKLNTEIADAMRASVLQAAIQGGLTEQRADDEPASALLERIREERLQLALQKKIKIPRGGDSVINRYDDGTVWERRGKGPAVEITDEVPFDIPESWEWARLESIAALERGAGIKRGEITDEGEPCVRYGELYTTYDQSVSDVKSHIPEELYAKVHKFGQGELLMTLTGENDIDIGRTVVNEAGRTIAYGGDLLALKCHRLVPRFFMYMMNSDYVRAQRTDAATGRIIVHLSAKKVGDFLLAIPPLAEQERIVAKLDEVMPLVEKLGKLTNRR